MARFIPANSECREFSSAAVVAYCYDSKQGPAYVAYKGRKGKPARCFAFVSEDHRDKHLSTYVEVETNNENFKRSRRETGHGLIAGEIVYAVWGYEQTNVDFFEVVRVSTARSAVIRRIESNTVEDKPGSMTGYATPKPGQFVAVAKEETRRANGFQRLHGGKSSLGDLQKWNGKPCRVTWYG
ncbi:hypothetical protein JWZ98_22980 (plasmid) [Methylomonas sp. EFPC1]|uniref:hypothetical protein n=1 Tax=Methylomonas sp. EFPC1 TaxID=2812647 RepID=UPI0019677EDA|nr:hypothetical protein [Methylomonas sp. EFPC1]QSB03778.1 hypothetical protein JWZ98_22980 [Methylomonas sp. EFPC1]